MKVTLTEAELQAIYDSDESCGCGGVGDRAIAAVEAIIAKRMEADRQWRDGAHDPQTRRLHTELGLPGPFGHPGQEGAEGVDQLLGHRGCERHGVMLRHEGACALP